MKLEVYESNDAIRLLDRATKVVVKYFKSSPATSTKIWDSDIDKTVSYWNTKKVDREATEHEYSLFTSASLEAFEVLRNYL
jgi:hypothetical protein